MNAASVRSAMAAVTRAFWHPSRSGGWFVFGGCLFWALFFYVIIAWLLVKLAVWALIEAVLGCWLLAVLAVTGCRTWMSRRWTSRRR